MRLNAKITNKSSDYYTIYFIISGGRDVELYSGEKLFLTRPEDETYTAWGNYRNISFDEIKFFYYNLPILDINDKLYEPIIWWELLTKTERRNLTGNYSPYLLKNNEPVPENIISLVYREFIFDQFLNNIILLAEYEIYLNWWKLLPWRTHEKIFYENLKGVHHYNYTFDDIKTLFELNLFSKEDLKILNWWFNFSENKKWELSSKCSNPHFNVKALNLEEIKILYSKNNEL
ncbi:MAG: hypothetical protein WCK02_02520 [Bacteroidota bacterium]